jgi:hypothetical protein
MRITPKIWTTGTFILWFLFYILFFFLTDPHIKSALLYILGASTLLLAPIIIPFFIISPPLSKDKTELNGILFFYFLACILSFLSGRFLA